ncbi:MAG TPA: HD domain-containing phosphohydrolase [Blastocatellia bacterium]|nr:HD domain-containing phosphohydrolase [Blastocatellia bacterium]
MNNKQRENPHERTRYPDSLIRALYASRLAVIEALLRAIESADSAARSHSERVAAYCSLIGKQMGLGRGSLMTLKDGALLHDVGKIGLPRHILGKQASLSEDEAMAMCAHVEYGTFVIEATGLLSDIVPALAQHHERYDGSGYPAGLCGESIHLHARIIALADAFDKLTGDYFNRRRTIDEATVEIISGAGAHFDPEVVSAFLKVSKAEWLDPGWYAGSQFAADTEFDEPGIDEISELFGLDLDDVEDECPNRWPGLPYA